MRSNIGEIEGSWKMSNKLKVLLFGANGLVGSGVLDECLDDERVETVTAVLRRGFDRHHPKFDEIIHGDFQDYSSIEDKLKGYDVCFWCLGIAQSQAKNESHYELITKKYTLAASAILKKLNPDITFIFVSGAGTKVNSRQMWARIKGETEAELGKMGFRNQYNIRPAVIRSVNGLKPKLLSYKIASILNPVFRLFFPNYNITNRQIGKVMIRLALEDSDLKTLENSDMLNLIKS
jgi:hypothetical protein